ncbi:hypothetical protein OBBRIDRAFT_864172 [Obba rivulosa]|uniref:DUF6533 domain-containing protein n=1 Tax=Obba rivulosa TaxID=1052685 RepID=A0A8E2ALJ9_9APHY|nr:hypothetical protein OBBRIDRAFT_864172 [Obba rivulosa]
MAATISFGSPPRSIQLIVCTIIFHEYLSTFPTEVEVIWTRQLMNLTSILFILNRYNLLSLAILYSISSSCTSNGAASSCPQIYIMFNVAISLVFSALRVYSIDNRNKYLAAVVFFLGMVPFVANTTYGTCSLPFLHSLLKLQLLLVVIVTRTCLIACDLIVLLVTWFNTGSAKAARKYSKMKASLLALLVRDG